VLLGLAIARRAAAQEFVWPVSGWVTANDEYFWGLPHGGSADVAAPYWTPVSAARDGTVVQVDGGDCHGVLLDHGAGWTTWYCHLVRTPVVELGESVRAGQLLGYVGRYGSANVPHLHFTIRRYGDRYEIPGLAYGTWVRRNSEIAGTYAGLGPKPPIAFTFTVRAAVPVSVLNAPRDTAAAVATLPAENALLVTDARDGFYSITEPLDGWVPMSAVYPWAGTMTDLKIATPSAKVRATPSSSAAVVYTYPQNYLLPGFSTRNGWYEVLFGYPTSYGWMAPADVVRTSSHRVAMVAATAAVRSGPGAQYALLGTLTMGTYYNYQTVFENRNGWLRIQYGGGTGWLQGWRTTGRR
jgi:hypothetical protein